MPSFFVAVKADSSADSKASRARLQLTLDELATAGDVVHVGCVIVEAYGPKHGRRERVQNFIAKQLLPVAKTRPDILFQYHVLPLMRPHGSYSDVAMCKAELLCSTAADLQCSVMVVGGGAKLRDATVPAFLLGHSIRHWILRISVVPVYETYEGLLTVHPAHSQLPDGPVHKFVQSVKPRVSTQLMPIAASA